MSAAVEDIIKMETTNNVKLQNGDIKLNGDSLMDTDCDLIKEENDEEETTNNPMLIDSEQDGGDDQDDDELCIVECN